jgi:acetyltransferase-like isoleucine patch superfamily enzyme
MTKADIVAEIAEEIGLEKNEVQKTVESFMNTVKKSLTNGDNVYLRGIAKGYQAGMSFPTTILADIPDSLIKIGNNCRINGAYIHAQNSIIIGNNCVIASNVNIIDTNGHEVYSKNRTIGRDKPLEIILEDNVWIGLNVIILKGTRIGRNSIVSAGSVVKGNFEENSIITGNPAKVVKKIFINEASHTK